jgi:hypothetical protein
MSNLLTEEKFGLTPAQIDGVMDSIYQRGDLLMKIFIMVHMLIALALAPHYGTWLVTLAVGPAAVLMFLISVTLMPRSFLTRVIWASCCRFSSRCTSTSFTGSPRCISSFSRRPP